MSLAGLRDQTLFGNPEQAEPVPSLPGGSKTWSPEMEATFRIMWDEGYSASKIGAAIGVSRNAVLGKRMRMGLTSRGRAHDGPTVSPEAKAKRAVEARKRRRAYVRGTIIPFKRTLVMTPEPSAEFRCDLFSLTSTTCRFPYGEGQYSFCGAPMTRGQSYCRYHAEICYSRQLVDMAPASADNSCLQS